MHRQHIDLKIIESSTELVLPGSSHAQFDYMVWKTTKLSAKPPSAFFSVCQPDEDEPILISLTSALTNNWENSQMGFKLLVKDLKDPRVISLSTQIN